MKKITNNEDNVNVKKTVPLEDIPGPPDGGWGWVVCLASFFCNFTVDGIAYSFGILLVPLVEYFDSSRSTISWVGSLLCGIYMASGPIVGGLVNKFGCRPVCIGGAIFSCLSLVLSTFSPNVGVLMLTYGVMGGFGAGCIYLPSVIICGYYFEKKRALATGIAVCGSGVGCFVFAPFTNFLLNYYGWKGTNLIFAGLLFNCAIFGAMMRPLQLVIVNEDHQLEEELMLRPAETEIKRKGSRVTSSILFEANTLSEIPENQTVRNDNSVPPPPSFNIDSSTTMATRKSYSSNMMPRNVSTPGFIIDEVKEASEEEDLDQDEDEDKIEYSNSSGWGRTTSADDNILRNILSRGKRERTISEVQNTKHSLAVPSNATNKAFIKRNVSTPGFGRLARLDSVQEREVQQILSGSSALVYEVQHGSTQQLKPYQRRSSKTPIVRPLSRKDIFYSGSIYNLALDLTTDDEKENKQIADLNALKGYRHSVVSIPRNITFSHRGSIVATHLSVPSEEIEDLEMLKEKLEITNPIWSVFKEMMNLNILLNPLFALICICNVFGFLAVYVPYVYLPNMTTQRGIQADSASFIISLIGVSNTLGRVLVGAFVDLPWVSSLVVTNISLIMSGLCILAFPFCHSYGLFIVVALFLGLSVSAFISLASIVMVELLGLDALTSSFGMLRFCTGVASILGPPLAGLVYDWTQQYNASFYMAGGFFIFGGVLGFIAYYMNKRK